VFGGEVFEANKTRVFSDFYRYQCKNNQWTHVESCSGPPPRSAHQVRRRAVATMAASFCTSPRVGRHRLCANELHAPSRCTRRECALRGLYVDVIRDEQRKIRSARI
jgi:hypothetical protein